MREDTNPYDPPRIEITPVSKTAGMGKNLSLRIRLGQIGNFIQGVCAVVFIFAVCWLIYGPPPFVERVVSFPTRAGGEYFYTDALWPMNFSILMGVFACVFTLVIGVKRQKLLSLVMLLFFASPILFLLGKESYDMIEVRILHGR